MNYKLLASLTACWTATLVLAQDNPWTERVAPAIEKARDTRELEDARAAFDAAYHADNWQAGLEFADWVTTRPKLRKPLIGYISRARYRAGQIFEAEDIIERVRMHEADAVTLEMRVVTDLARGDFRQARRAALELEQREPRTTGGLLAMLAVADHESDIEKAQKLVAETLAHADPNNGYPDIYVAEGLGGIDDFLNNISKDPVNKISRPGKAELKDLPLVAMLACEVEINGHGPYNMILDTGGSVVISLDQTVADEIGITSLGEAAIRGVSGKGSSSQVLFDEVQIDGIKMSRVMGRVFDVHTAAAYSADGIIGTGIFSDGRMTIDLENGRLIVSRSKSGDARGDALATRIVGDGKILTDVRINGLQKLAFWDTGASITLVSPTLLRELSGDKELQPIPGMDTGMGIMGVGGENGPMLYQGQMIELRLGHKVHRETAGLGLDVLDTVISPVIGVQTDLLIGLPMVREMKSMTVDYPRRRLWVDWLD